MFIFYYFAIKQGSQKLHLIIVPPKSRGAPAEIFFDALYLQKFLP